MTPTQAPKLGRRAGLAAAPLLTLLVTLGALLGGVHAARWLEDGRLTRFYGYVQPQVTTVCAPRAGVLAELPLQSGEPAEPGSVVARLADPVLAARLEEQSALVARLEAEVERAVAEAELELQWRLREVDADICSVQLLAAGFLQEKYNLELRSNMLADLLARDDVAMFNASSAFLTSIMLPEGEDEVDRMTTVLRLEIATNAAEVSAAQIELCEQRRQRLETLRGELPEAVQRRAGVTVARMQLSQARDELTRLEAARAALEVRSPVVGRAGIPRVQPGQPVALGAPIVDLLDDCRREVVVSVPSEEIPAFVAGKEVEVLFPGRRSLRGRIAAVAPQARTVAAAVGEESYIDVTVHPAGELWPEAPAGSRVQVRVCEAESAAAL